MPRITITDRQRAPIYGQLRRRLAGIDDIRAFAEADPDEAARLAFQYADDFRLFEDIGWDRENPREAIRLTMPPTDLRRVLMRLQAEAEGELSAAAEEERQQREERGEERDQSMAAREACRDLLDDLDAELEGRQHGACI